MPNLAVNGARRRNERLSLRATNEERALIEQAALLSTGGDVTRFIIAASVQAAREVVEEHEVSRVTSEMRQAFYELLLHPPAPNKAFRDLAANPVPDGFTLVD